MSRENANELRGLEYCQSAYQVLNFIVRLRGLMPTVSTRRVCSRDAKRKKIRDCHALVSV